MLCEAGDAGAGAYETVKAASSMTLDEVVMAFETLVPEEEAKRYGAVFTPAPITAFMAKEAVRRLSDRDIDLSGVRAIDPSVGCGALLIAVLERLAETLGADPADVAERLYGVDISANSVHRASILITLACLALGSAREPNLAPNLRVADSLTVAYADLFGEEAATFDLVIGNPPYVRYQHLDLALREQLAASWVSCSKGNFNLYFPFFELAHRLADPAGSVIAYITPNQFFTSLSGGPLRSWMVECRYLDDVVDFGHHRVFNAMTYTAITFASRGGTRPASFGYLPVAGLPGLAKVADDWAVSAVNRYAYDRLGSSPWRLVGKTEHQQIRKITKAGPALSEVADVRFGLATLRDKLYMLKGVTDEDGYYIKELGGVAYRIEPDLTMPLIRVSSVSNQEEMDNVESRIIYPYTLNGSQATIIAEDTLRSSYPEAYGYLCAIRPELAKRDKGKKKYAAWYAYGRTQGLVPAGRKLLTPLYAAMPRFLWDTNPDSLFVNGCAVTVRPDAPDWVSLELLELVLNSAVCQYYIESTGISITGGFYAYQKSQLAGLGVPKMDAAQVEALRALGPEERDVALAHVYGVELPAELLRRRRELRDARHLEHSEQDDRSGATA